MGHYLSNVRDLEFNLFEALRVGELLPNQDYGIDTDTVRFMLHELARLAEDQLAGPYAQADRTPPVFDAKTHAVTIPDSFKATVKALRDGSWDMLGLPKQLGGTPIPRPVFWALSELILGAQPAAFMYAMAGPNFAEIVYAHGTPEQRRWAQFVTTRGWGATMTLTEPDAGSDVGSARTRAISQADGSWHLEGTKRFITAADSDDLFENIMHLVLARPEGARAGTKGLSLFLVPKFHFNLDTGQPSHRNGVFVTAVADKMGLKASATCDVVFGGHGVPATGWLLGDVHNGIAQMFAAIEHARMMVGTKAIATLSSGYLNALAYAKVRIQGTDIARRGDTSAPRIAIIGHAEVRHSLMMQKAYAEGLRAIYMYAAAHQDPVTAKFVSGAEPDMAARVNDLLLPVVKGVGSERAYQYLGDALQTYGGSGYLRDYPLEQYLRDAKIDSLYEGTTAIQAQDFFYRKIARDHGRALAHILTQITAFLAEGTGNGRLKTSRRKLRTALTDIEEIVSVFTTALIEAKNRPAELYKIGLGSIRFLMAFGDLLVGWQLLQHAAIALDQLDRGTTTSDTDYYEGKVAVAEHFAHHVLPQITTARTVLTDTDDDIMRLNAACF